MNMGFSFSNARMDQLELAVISSTATITQNVATALAQSTVISGNTDAVDISNRNRNTAISSSSQWRAKRPSDRVAYLRLPFLLQRSWELAVYRANGGWHVSLTASRIVPNDSPFLVACGKGDLVKVRAMLISGEGTVLDVNSFGENGLFVRSPIYLNPSLNSVDSIQVALDDCKYTGSNADTDFATCQLLLEAGANVNAQPMVLG